MKRAIAKDQPLAWIDELPTFVDKDEDSKKQEDIKQCGELQVQESRQQLEEVEEGDVGHNFLASFDDLPCFIEHDEESINLVISQQHEVEGLEVLFPQESFHELNISPPTQKCNERCEEDLFQAEIESFCSCLDAMPTSLEEDYQEQQ